MPVFSSKPGSPPLPTTNKLVGSLFSGILALLIIGVFTRTAIAEPQIIKLTEAQFVITDAANPPASTAAWHATRLTDRWPIAR